jgi:hypothetical protein
MLGWLVQNNRMSVAFVISSKIAKKGMYLIMSMPSYLGPGRDVGNALAAYIMGVCDERHFTLSTIIMRKDEHKY